jgi:TonB family protein
MLILRHWIAAAVCVGLFADAARPQTGREFQVKSAYLYNIATRAQWPEHTLPNDKSKLVICVFGGEPDFPDVLKSTLAGKEIRENPIEIRHLQSSGELNSCHLAFIRVANGNARAALAQLENTNVLSVGEDKEFLSQGGMINLSVEGGDVRFELNSAAIERANIRYGRQASPSSRGDQETTLQNKTARALRISSQPLYPGIAKTMNLRGSVQLEVTVKPDGSVKDVRVIGGHPLLADAAVKSVKQWRYEPSGRETTELVKLNFEIQ